MNTYTIVAYILSAGGHHVEESEGMDPADAAIRLRNKHGLTKEDFEIVGIIPGKDPFVNFDCKDLNLAPFTALSP